MSAQLQLTQFNFDLIIQKKINLMIPDEVRMDFGTLHEVNVFTVGGLGFILNTVLIILIRKKSPPEFKAYASFLTLNAYVDGLHSLAILTTQSVFLRADGYGIFVAAGPVQLLPQWVSTAMIVLNVSLYFAAMIIMPWTFVCRYQFICRNVTNVQGIFYATVVSMLGYAMFIIAFYYSYFTPTDTAIFGQYAQIVNVMMHFRNADGIYNIVLGTKIGSPENLFINYLAAIQVIASFVLAVLFTWKIHAHLARQRASLPLPVLKLQSQLTKSLIFQIILPFCTVVLPSTVGFIFDAFHIKWSLIYVIFSLSSPWICVFNPFLTLYFVGPFRRALTTGIMIRGKNTALVTPPMMG